MEHGDPAGIRRPVGRPKAYPVFGKVMKSNKPQGLVRNSSVLYQSLQLIKFLISGYQACQR
jgi:hypothetical protein